MTSTERTLRDTLVSALRAAAGDLGFDELEGNVRDYLIEHEVPEQRDNYLTTLVSNNFAVRAIAVWVTSYDEPMALTRGPNNLMLLRTYSVEVRAYVELGINGIGAREAIDLDSKIRAIVLALGSQIRPITDAFVGMQPARFNIISTGGRDVATITRVFTYTKDEPDNE